jgi:hypothetical protein
MSGDTIECFNCGHANPSWAQVCRQCGFALRPDGRAPGGPRGILPTDQASLISIGGTLGAIVLAIVLGLFVSGLIPPALNVAAETPSPTASSTPLPSVSIVPVASGSAAPSGGSITPLIGTITFGSGLNSTTHEVTGQTTAFSAGVAFAHSVRLTEPFGVATIQEEVTRVADGVIVQKRVGSDLDVTATSMIAGYRVKDAGTLIPGWGTGTFILRVYRGEELLAEGAFSLS